MGRRSFGHVRKLPSGQFQASYIGPDDKRYLGPITFPRKEDAEVFLAGIQSDIARDKWEDPRKRQAREREELIQHDLAAATTTRIQAVQCSV